MNLETLQEVLKFDFNLQIDDLSVIDKRDLVDHGDVYFGTYGGRRIFVKIGDRHMRGVFVRK